MRLPVQYPELGTNPMDFGLNPAYGQLGAMAVQNTQSGTSVWDNLSPFQAYLAESFSNGAKNRGKLDMTMKRALVGESLEEQDANDFKVQAQQDAIGIAQDAAGMDDEEYNQLKSQLKQMVAQRPQKPGMPNLQTPSAAALGVAGIGALLNPQFGAQIAATPFQEGLRQQEQGYEQSMLGYQDELKARQEEMQFLESQMDDARSDRQTRINAAIRLKELVENQRQFDTREANDLKAVEMAIQGRADIAGTKASTDLMKSQLAGAYAAMRSTDSGTQEAGLLALRGLAQRHPELLNDPEVLDAMQGKLAGLSTKEQLDKDRSAEIQNKIYWRNKETPVKIQNVLASKGLKEAQKAQIMKITSLLDDRFALDFATSFGRLAVALQNADTYANRGLVDDSLNDMRLLLNAQLNALTGQMALEPDEKKKEEYKLRINAVTNQLLGLDGDGQGGLGGLMEPVEVPPVAPTLPPELEGYIGRPAPGTQKKAPGKPTQQKKAPPKKGRNRINIVGIREKR